MMISPEAFYEKNLKGKTEKQILTEIRSLKNSIGRLKNQMESPSYDRAKNVCPSPEAMISCMRAYLFRAIETLCEMGLSYAPSIAEKKSIEFQARIKDIARIEFETGGFFCGHKRFSITIESDSIRVKYEPNFYDEIENETEFLIAKSEAEKSEIMDKFSRLYMGEWRRSYTPERFGYIVLDGVSWSISIIYWDKKKRSFSGDNAFPYNFDSFAKVFGIDKMASFKYAK